MPCVHLGQHGIILEVAEVFHLVSRNSQADHFFHILLALHGKKGKRTKHGQKESLKKGVFPVRFPGDAAVDQERGNIFSGNFMQKIRPEIGFYEQKKIRPQSLDKAPHHGIDIKGERDKEINRQALAASGELLPRRGGCGKKQHRVREMLSDGLHQGDGRGDLAHGQGMNPDAGTTRRNFSRQLTQPQTEPGRNAQPVFGPADHQQKKKGPKKDQPQQLNKIIYCQHGKRGSALVPYNCNVFPAANPKPSTRKPIPMNIILIDPAEVKNNRVTLRDRRSDHIRNVLGAACGDTLRTGLINGPMGTSTVIAIAA